MPDGWGSRPPDFGAHSLRCGFRACAVRPLRLGRAPVPRTDRCRRLAPPPQRAEHRVGRAMEGAIPADRPRGLPGRPEKGGCRSPAAAPAHRIAKASYRVGRNPPPNSKKKPYRRRRPRVLTLTRAREPLSPGRRQRGRPREPHTRARKNWHYRVPLDRLCPSALRWRAPLPRLRAAGAPAAAEPLRVPPPGPAATPPEGGRRGRSPGGRRVAPPPQRRPRATGSTAIRHQIEKGP